MEKQKIKVSKSRQLNTYAETWHASHVMIYKAEKDEEGSYYQLMASLVFTAFTLEAYLNHIGKRIFICWDDLEQLSPQKKINIIAEKLRVEKDDGKRPFQTVKKLFKFRNDVAHGKDVFLESDEEIWITNSRLGEYMLKCLKAEWEGYCTSDNAKRAREDVESIIQKFHEASNINDDNLFFLGMSTGHATLIHKE
jgi:hypothetical protein